MDQSVQSIPPLLTPQFLLCSNANKAFQVCSSPNCTQQQVFICSQFQCKCNKLHRNTCSFLKVDEFLRKIQQQRLPITSEHQFIIDSISQTYSKMIQEISISKIQFEDSINYFGLGPNAQEVVKMIEQNRRQQISGKKVFQTMQQHGWSKQLIPPYQILIEKLRRQIETNVANLIQGLNQLYLGKQEADNTLIEEFRQFAKIEHKPIRDEGGRPVSSIEKWLKDGKKIREIRIFAYTNKNLQQGISPSIGALTGVKTLCLTNCHIKKIQHFEKLIFMNRLLLHVNKIEKIQNIDQLINLQILQLSNNKIKKIQNLDKLVNLQELWLVRNNIKVFQNLNFSPKLHILQLYSNQSQSKPAEIQLLNKLAMGGVQIYFQSRTIPYEIKEIKKQEKTPQKQINFQNKQSMN